MKPLLPIGAVCAVFLSLGTASAQDTVIVPAPAPKTVVVQPEQQTAIQEYAHKNPAASINILGLELSLGAKVPDTVELHEVPNVPYRYTVINGQTVLVDPETHEIVEVLN
ncbi:MAG: DUF1236 domain-containing protein [Mesorhizobium sp.]